MQCLHPNVYKVKQRQQQFYPHEQNSNTKKKVYKIWKQEEVTQKGYRGTVEECSQESPSPPELETVWDMKINEKCFYRYLRRKRKMRENVSLMLKGAEDLMPEDMENAKTLNTLFALVFIGNICLQESQTPEINGEV